MESLDRAYLQHENEMYDGLRAIQWKHVPVCLGSIDLVRPYYYNSDVYVHFMFLSWAGRLLFDCGDQAKTDFVRGVATIFKAVHELRVLHCDAEPRNILYDTNSGNLMVVNFERAEFRGRQPLDSVGPNSRNRRGSGGHLRNKGRTILRESWSLLWRKFQGVLRACPVIELLVWADDLIAFDL